MRNSWFFFMDLDGGSPYIFPTEPIILHSFRGQLLSQIGLFVDNSLHKSGQLYAPGSLALQETFSCISKFAGALLLWFSSGSNSSLHNKLSGNPHGSKPGSYQCSSQVRHVNSCEQKLVGFHSASRSRADSAARVIFGKIVNSSMRHIWQEVDQLQSFGVLSLAAALIPPFDNFIRSPKVLSVPLENTDVQINGHIDQTTCVCEHRGSADLSFPEINWTNHTVEPLTGINFPGVLDNVLAGENNSTLTSEVLVGTGSKIMRIIKIKSLRVYAFGLYVHPGSICETLGSKYASVPIGELKKRADFFEDLLREDIDMTVRLVVNCNGLKIKTVQDAFEKSLRTRLLKMNPNTDFHCLRKFSSYFTQDIPFTVGTKIDFRQTADGQLITEVGGKQIGVVHSKDLCRAFFSMYIGDVPVSVQAKEEIARNVGCIMRGC